MYKKNINISFFILGFFLVLTIVKSSGSFASSIADKEMYDIAKPYVSTMKLTAHTRFGEHFSGSAVYLGKNKAGEPIALTNAHCVDFWYRARKWCASFSIDHVDNEGIKQFKVIAVEFHPKRFSHPKDDRYDVVKLKLSNENHPDESLASPPYYGPETQSAPSTDFETSGTIVAVSFQPLDNSDAPTSKGKDSNEFYGPLVNELCVAVGYGTSGLNSVYALSTNDKKKRGTNIRMHRYYAAKNSSLLLSMPYGKKLNNQTALYENVNICSSKYKNEYGVRYGMSGGGLYQKSDTSKNLNDQLVGICRGHYSAPESLISDSLKRIRSLYSDNFGKYCTAAGIRMPFMNPVNGDSFTFISLSPLKDWINSPVQANGQTQEQYIQSWVPSKKTAGLLTLSISTIGYALWSYLL